jgi:hypothetical protein
MLPQIETPRKKLCPQALSLPRMFCCHIRDDGLLRLFPERAGKAFDCAVLFFVRFLALWVKYRQSAHNSFRLLQ